MRYLAISLLFVVSSTYAATVPNNFGPGTRVTNAKLNANFQALIDAITALENPVVTVATVAGTYKYDSQSIGVGGGATGGGGTQAQVMGEHFYGTVVLSPDGNATFTMNGDATGVTVDSDNTAPHTHSLQSGNTGSTATGSTTTATVTHDSGPENGTGTWTVTNGEVLITDDDGGVTTLLPASERLLMGVTREAAEPGSTTDFYILNVLIKQ